MIESKIICRRARAQSEQKERNTESSVYPECIDMDAWRFLQSYKMRNHAHALHHPEKNERSTGEPESLSRSHGNPQSALNCSVERPFENLK